MGFTTREDLALKESDLTLRPDPGDGLKRVA